MKNSKVLKRVIIGVMSMAIVLSMSIVAFAGEITPNGQGHPIGQQGSPGGGRPIDPPTQ